MKKVTAFFLAALMVMTIFVMPVFAKESYADQQVIATVQAEMLVRRIDTENLNVEVINDTSGEPKYLLGTSESGYIILDKDTFVFHEAGEGNPFALYKDAEKYYGGPLCYFVRERVNVNSRMGSNGYYDVVKKNIVQEMYAAEFNERNDAQDQTQGVAEQAANSESVVSSAYSYIQRRAFGYNDDNTCSAVATGILLNYLSLRYNKPFVSAIAEYRNNGTPDSAAALRSSYPNAYALHRCLADEYGMGPVSYALGIVDPLIAYIEGEVPGYHGFTVSWTYAPKAATIKSNIEDDKPVLITTTIAGEYSLHTMLCYGYRENSGKAELLVHTGWYNSDCNEIVTGECYRQIEKWISESYATIGYYSSFNE